jgi:hypothetical protein
MLPVGGPRKWKKPGVKFKFGCHPTQPNFQRVKFDFGPLNPKRPVGPLNGLKPRSRMFRSLHKRTNARVTFKFGPRKNGCRVWWGPKMVKTPGVKFEFVCLPKRTNASVVIFDFGTLIPKIPQWVPKIGKGLKFEFGSLPKRTNALRVKFDFRLLNTERPQWAPKIVKSPRSKI